jgi:hypothetical protein
MIVAISAVSVLFAARAVMVFMAILAGAVSLVGAALPIAISISILVGMFKAHKLAWQWGRALGALGATICTFITIMLLIETKPREGDTAVLVFSGCTAVICFVIVLALRTKSAKRYFKLVCPACGSMKCKGANFLFTKVKCLACGSEWGEGQVGLLP